MKSLLLRFVAACAVVTSIHAAPSLDSAMIDEITGLKGKWNEAEGVYRVTFPRSDVKVSVDRWAMPPFMGLGTWAAFTKAAHAEAMVMGCASAGSISSPSTRT